MLQYKELADGEIEDEHGFRRSLPFGKNEDSSDDPVRPLHLFNLIVNTLF